MDPWGDRVFRKLRPRRGPGCRLEVVVLRPRSGPPVKATQSVKGHRKHAGEIGGQLIVLGDRHLVPVETHQASGKRSRHL